MSTIIGRQVDLGIAKESVRGTAVAPTFWLPLLTKNVEDTFAVVIDDAPVGVIEGDEDSQVVKKWAAGDIEGYVREKSIGLLLLNLFGAVVTSDNPDTDPSVKDHDFSVLQSVQHPSLTVALKHPNEGLRFALGMINTFSFSIVLDSLVRFSANIMARKGASAADTVAYTSESEFNARHVTVKFATNLAGLDAATAIKAKAVTVNFEKNIESDDIVGSVDPNDFNNKKFMVNGTVELLYDDTTHKLVALASTAKALRVELKNTDVTIGATSNPTLQVDMAKVKITEWSSDKVNDDLVRQVLTFSAYYSMTDSKMVTAKLTNTQASY